jgi:probable phosphoglycerate mutase
LTPEGEKKAAALRQRLGKMKFDAVFSSPLQRARRTADLAGFPDAQLTPVLREVDYGEYEGMTTKAIHLIRPDWELYKDGSPGGETPAQIYARAMDFITLASASSGRVLAFSHGHFLRAVAIAWMRLGIQAASTLHLDVATLSLLRDDERGRVLAMWNSPP